jgi:2-polyprenyl-3-methyl-5-hydroxy-6-metoxy-1,4-benzoquinol methylase
MDNPMLSNSEQQLARSGLARLNKLSGAAHAIWRSLHPLLKKNKVTEVLDVATGAADVPLRLWEIAKSCGVDLQIDGCDMNTTVLQQARINAKTISAPSKFFVLSVPDDPLPQNYDVIITSLFTHHLSESATVDLLNAMKVSAKSAVIIYDLVRSPLNYVLIWLTARMVSTSNIVHFDGPTSVLNSYTSSELLALAQQAGLHNAEIKQIFPCRMILTWKKENA